MSLPLFQRLLPASSLAALCLSACSLEPITFWMDTPKGETDITLVPSPPVPKKPGFPTGLNVTILPGYVRTPFTHPPRLVDVRGLQPGRLVVCPFTQKLFYLPVDFVDARPSSQAPAERMHLVKREPVYQPLLRPLPPAALPAAPDPDLPFGIAVPGRPGYVYSPYADRSHMVDVTGLAAGMEVKCPYSGKIFRVPGAKR